MKITIHKMKLAEALWDFFFPATALVAIGKFVFGFPLYPMLVGVISYGIICLLIKLIEMYLLYRSLSYPPTSSSFDA